MKDEIIIYQAEEGTTRLEVKIEEDSVWLNRQQISTLFERDIKTIGKHIANILTEELKGIPVVAKFATTATDGKTYQVEYYNLDVIISVGYRVKSTRGIQFRIWANKVLKDYLLKGYAVSDRKTIYHLGASLKDLGKKWFAFSILNLEVQDILCKLDKNLIKEPQ
ncbi:MAG: RhuM family protein [Bacteroidales bacterium]|jgi:hypothetical protein